MCETVIGFSLKKRNLLRDFELNQTPIVLDNVRTEIECTGSKKHIISDRSVIKGTTVTFPNDESCGYKVLNLDDVSEFPVSSDDQYIINGRVVKVLNVQEIRNGELKKQDIHIASETSKISLILYGDLCNSVDYVTPTKTPGLDADISPVPSSSNGKCTSRLHPEISPLPSSSKGKCTSLDRLDEVFDELKCSYAQYVCGPKSLMDMMPPEMKSASRMIEKGEAIIGQKLHQMKYLLQSVRQSLIAKEQTIGYLRQELANL